MADEDVQESELDDEAEGVEDEESAGRRKISGKMMVLAGAVVVLLAGGVGGAYWMGLFSSGNEEVADAVPVEPSVFYDMPEMLVNLNQSLDSRSRFLKLRVALEMTDSEVLENIEPQLPRIMDIFQIYLRELRLDDLEGSAGIYRLKEELLRRINIVLSPQRIDRILFREMLVQ